jgi:hypothetical protein
MDKMYLITQNNVDAIREEFKSMGISRGKSVNMGIIYLENSDLAISLK